MTHDEKSRIPQVRLGPISWLNDSLRIPVEETVSKFKGYEWIIKNEKDLSEFACHHCAIVSDNSFAAFFKYSDAAEAKQQFEIELSGLQILSKRTGVLIPQPISIVRVENGTLLIMEALETVEREAHQWRQTGTTLAHIHRVKDDHYGFKRNGFYGPLHQDNTPERDWITFFRERRLLPLLKVAIDSGNVPLSIISKMEKLICRLPQLCGPEVAPSLLHGDAQQNNFISTTDGTFVIDPAVYYGHPEMDLALIDSFQPVPDAFFDGYRDEMPIASDFFERRDLWRLPLYFAAVALEGPMHLNKLTSALQKYL